MRRIKQCGEFSKVLIFYCLRMTRRKKMAAIFCRDSYIVYVIYIVREAQLNITF